MLQNNKCLRQSINRTESKGHRISLSCFDDKNIYSKQWIWWLSSLLSKLIRKNNYLNNYFTKSFFVKRMVLIFSLIWTAFLSNIFSQVKTAFWPVYKILSDFWLGILSLKNAKYSKNDKWRINANSLTS